MTSLEEAYLPYCAIPRAGIRTIAANISIAIFDVDGVLTDGTVYSGTETGQMLAFHIHDGKGLRMLIESGITVAWATARGGKAVACRARELGVEMVIDGCQDKADAVRQIADECGHGPSACAYTGDDLIDIGALRLAGLGVAVADAHPQVVACADWVTQRPGGRGAVRELAELILFSQNRLRS